MADTVEERLANLAAALACVPGVTAPARRFGFTIDLRDRMIAAGLVRSYPIDDNSCASRQGVDGAIGGEGLRHAAKEVESDLSRRLRISGDSATSKKRLDLGGKAKRPAIVGIIERLDAVGVPGKKQGLVS